MKVQNIGQNNYNNYQTNQNTRKQPAFGVSVICGFEKLSMGGLAGCR